VPKTKLDEATEEYVGMFLNKDNQKLTEEQKGGKNVVTRHYDFDMKTARERFDEVFGNTNELKEMQAYALQRYDMASDDERLDQEVSGYVSIDRKGQPYITNDNLFNYIRDTRLKKQQVISEEPITYRPPTQADLNARARQEDAMATVNDIDRLYTNDGSPSLYGKIINHGMRKGTVTSAKMSFDPITNKSVVTVYYEYVGKDGTKRQGAMKQDKADAEVKQLLGRTFDPKFDYIDTKNKLDQSGAYISVNPEGANITNRAESFSVEAEDNKWKVYDAIKEVNAGESASYDKIKGIVDNVGIPALSSFISNNFDQAESFKTGDYLKLGDKTYDLSVEDQRISLSNAIGAMVVTAQNMNVSKFNEKEITEALGEVVQNIDNPEFSLDPLVREAVKNNFSTEELNNMLIQGATTEQALAAIRGKKQAIGQLTTQKMAVFNNIKAAAKDPKHKGYEKAKQYVAAWEKYASENNTTIEEAFSKLN